MSARRTVEITTRRAVGSPYTVHMLVVDGRVVRARLGPFDVEEIERAATEPVAPTRAPEPVARTCHLCRGRGTVPVPGHRNTRKDARCANCAGRGVVLTEAA